jgi:DNA-binding transcriptional LysR family regulator
MRQANVARISMRIRHAWSMSMTAWRTFTVVCDEGSISAAARELGYTQSAVSRQVAALEQDVGAPLLERLPRGVRPTPAGEALLPHARTVWGELGRARDSVRRAAAGTVGVLRLAAVPSAAVDLVPRALRVLREHDASSRCLLHTGLSPALLDQVAVGDADLAVVTDFPPGIPHDPALARTHLLDDEMVVLLPLGHRLAAGRRRVSLRSLSDESWVEDNAGSERMLVRAASRAGFEPRLELVAGDLLGKVGLVSGGLGVALAPGLLTGGLPPGVAVRRLVDPPTRGVYAVRRVRRARPGVDDLERALAQAASGSRAAPGA